MKKILIVISMFVITFGLTACNNTNNTNSYPNPDIDYCVPGKVDGVYICEDYLTSYFNTTISLKLYYDSQDTYNVEDIFTYYEATIQLYHQYFDKYNAYDGITNIYTINNSNTPIVLDEILYDAIDFALSNQDLIVENDMPLFDIALGPVLEIWHQARESVSCSYDEQGISYCPVPRDDIDGQSFNTNPSDIVLDEDILSLTFLKENMSIDLGGMAKGYVSKVISEYLNNLGITYLLNTGNSNIIANGVNSNNDDGYYYIALTRPSTEYVSYSDYYLFLKIPEDLAVVTSGNYQRFFKGEDDDLIYHHIIDPNSNYPGGYSMSVTILYPDSALADILSTAIYLMPIDDAVEFVNNFPDLEAVWYFQDETTRYSDGFSEFIYET